MSVISRLKDKNQHEIQSNVHHKADEAKSRLAIQANVLHKADEGQKPAGDPGKCPS
ncbi:hypothetical protein [Bacillus litorisediminis]|uniref:hypothetical protein n=1 Tax=Bacillus litorisediminis TaxID=2922713 RepID=UPI001FB03DED|nr:hypothetical protein [Bacillus litorisediminis]